MGPSVTLGGDEFGGTIRSLKADLDEEIEVARPDLARSLTDLWLIDEYRVDQDVIRLTYVPREWGKP